MLTCMLKYGHGAKLLAGYPILTVMSPNVVHAVLAMLRCVPRVIAELDAQPLCGGLRYEYLSQKSAASFLITGGASIESATLELVAALRRLCPDEVERALGILAGRSQARSEATGATG